MKSAIMGSSDDDGQIQIKMINVVYAIGEKLKPARLRGGES